MSKKLLLALVATLTCVVSGCDVVPVVREAIETARNKEEIPVKATFYRLQFDKLAGWQSDDHAAALAAFKTSCLQILAKSPSSDMGGQPIYGSTAQWRAVCQTALSTSPQKARAFFESGFSPVEVRGDDNAVGLFTGYYEPELNGSRVRQGRFQTPLLARPTDLVMVDLGEFYQKLKGERIAGRVEEGRLKPYATRAEIVAGSLKGTATPLVYVDDAWEAFSLQIQGSGRVKLQNGQMIRLNYDGQNGHPYTAIGRKLVDRGAIRREDLSMQSIRSWLKANPKQAASIMDLNASYVFFKDEPVGDPLQGAPGAMKVPLSPERSLAVDLRFHALGVPLWIDATRPGDGGNQAIFQHLLVAHDTGGAIRGPVRGDVYWGSGARAEELAGRMANRGRLIALIPNDLAKSLPTAP